MAGAVLVTLAVLSSPAPREAFAAAVGQARARGQTASRESASASAQEVSMPFRVGEKLDYNVAWSSFSTAASVELSIPEKRDLYGWQTWHFRAIAHTESPVRTLFPIDDEFDSYTDTTTLESHIYQTYLNELGRKWEQTFQFVPEGQTPRAPGPGVLVPAGTRDPLGVFYELRGVDWQRENDASARVYDGSHFYEMRASKEASGEAVEVSAGKFSTTRIGVQVFEQGKPISGVSFTIWLAENSSRTPVLMQADMPFGTLRIEMIASSTP